jgi:hypothetical protein
VFSTDEKMHILAKADAHMGTRVALAAMFALLVSMLNTVVNKQSEIEKSYSRCGPSFSKEPKALKTLPLEELETILSAWFKQARTANASTDGPHLKEKALHVAALLCINSFWASSSWINCFKKRHNLVYKTMSEESAIVKPKTVMDSKSEEMTKVTDGYQPKDIFRVDEIGLLYNLQPNKTLTYKGDSCHGGTK